MFQLNVNLFIQQKKKFKTMYQIHNNDYNRFQFYNRKTQEKKFQNKVKRLNGPQSN